MWVQINVSLAHSLAHTQMQTKVLYVVIHADVVGIVKNIFLCLNIYQHWYKILMFAKLHKNGTNCKTTHKRHFLYLHSMDNTEIYQDPANLKF